jgi:hypothetical protein
VADVSDVQRKFRSLVNQDRTCCLDQMAMVASAFTHDQALCRAHTARGPVERNWLVQNKVSAHLKGLLDTGLAAHYCKGNAALVGFTLPQFAKNQRAVRHVVTIDQESVIFATQQNVAGLISIVGKIQVNIGRVKDSAYRTMYFRVTAEKERL